MHALKYTVGVGSYMTHLLLAKLPDREPEQVQLLVPCAKPRIELDLQKCSLDGLVNYNR